MIRLTSPTDAKELDHVRKLIRAFNEWHRASHPEDLELIDSYFDPVAFEHELASLPGKYGPPGGHLILAYVDDEPAGCVAFRKLDDDSCEMKRMFVYPEFHGRGVGRALGEGIVKAARDAGYRVIRLDTSIRQKDATKLYSRLGFQYTEPYHDVSEALQNWLVFMELKLVG